MRSHIQGRSLADIRAPERIDAAERSFLDTLGVFPCYPVSLPLLDRHLSPLVMFVSLQIQSKGE